MKENRKCIINSFNAAGMLIAALVLTAFVSCAKKTALAPIHNTELAESIVQEVSPDFIGRLSPLALSFSQEVVSDDPEVLAGLLELKPAQRGSWKLLADRQTVSFTPEKPYKPGQVFTLTADLDGLLQKEELGTYQKRFCAMSPSYSVSFNELVLNDQASSYTLTGYVTTDIPVDMATASKMVRAKGRTVEWDSADGGEAYRFTIRNITPGSKEQKINVSYNGKALGLSKKQDLAYCGTKTFTIPSAGDFSIVDVNTSKRNTILVSFSQPLATSADLASCIVTRTADNAVFNPTDMNVTARRNVLTIYSDNNFEDIAQLTLDTGIQSEKGVYLAKATDVSLDSHWDLPAVDFLTDGTILPTSQGAILPVKTRNLSGLLIQAYAIYDRNMIQFLQVNELDGTSEMYRVGEPVWTKNVSFDWSNSMQNKFIPRGIDMSDLVKKYPDGMFQIRISFRPKNIKYVCDSNHRNFSTLEFPADTIDEDLPPRERSSWDYWDDDMDYEKRSTYWSYRDDPCHPAFYTSRYNSGSLIKRNIVISDLGLMVKKAVDGSLFVTVADIKTAMPVKGAKVNLHSYVGTSLYSSITNDTGTATFRGTDKVYFISAKYGSQTSYLKLSEGSSLSVSHFETGGVKNDSGLKGFIYGERGVWRPGDDMYLTFVVQDTNKKVPATMPANFTLQDPMGRTTDTQVISNSLDGFYTIKTKTQPSSPTGVWTARVKLGGQEWSRSLRVEAVVPNRLAVNLTSSRKELSPDSNEFTLKGAWLHGAPTPEFSADVSVIYSPTTMGFDSYSDYTFNNPSLSFSSSKETIWSGRLDKDSKAVFTKRLNAGSALPGKLRANFTSRIFEPSGAFSVEQTSLTYSPYKQYVGLKLPKGDAARGMLLTDIDHTADVVLLDSDGKAVKSGSLKYTVFKLDWKWWWEKDALTNATYVTERNARKITEGTVDITNGRGNFKFQIKYPDWGRYLVVASDGYNGHSAAKIVYIDWPGWAGRAQEGGSGSASMVTLIADKKQYTVGENAMISFASGKNQTAYVTVEKAGQVIAQQCVKTKEGTTTIKVPIQNRMAPNIYVHLTLLQQHLQTANSLPVRLYGVIPLMVEDPATKLSPVITTSTSTFEPGKKATFSVSENSGKQMTYTLAVVDEGLLGLTNYHGENLHNEFYKKEASQLQNWDLYKYVMNAYSGKLETLISIGGSEDFVDDRDRSANRFKPVVQFFGPFHINAGEKKATSFDMPQYVGAVRAIVIAGHDGAYGVAEKSVPVKSNLMIQPVLPRTLGINENMTVPITLFNGTQSDQRVTVTMTAKGALNLRNTKTVTVPASGNTNAQFTFATDRAGIADFNFKAESSVATANADIAINVESRGIPVTYSTAFTVEPGDSYNASVQSPGEFQGTTVNVELSTLPTINLTERLSYLIEYPHGCIEQITSGGFPQIFLPGYLTLTPENTDKVKANVKSVIDRYPEYQTSSGGFAYWPGNTEPNAWGSCYGAHFLLAAKSKGYSVPATIFDPLIAWIEKSSNDYYSSNSDSVSTQAYKLFVLALAGKPNISAMNRLRNNIGSSEVSAQLLLSSAYSLAGRKDTAEEILKSVTVSKRSYRKTGGSFSSDTREQAMYLYAAYTCGKKQIASAAAKLVADKLSSKDWLSTQETAWALFSMLPYYSEQRSGAGTFIVKSGSSSKSGSIKKGAETVELAASKASTQDATIQNTGKSTIYGILTASGRSVPGTEKAESNGLAITTSYKDENGDTVNPAKLKTGDSFVMRVKVKNSTSTDLKNIALTIPVPTGWEFGNDRAGGLQGSGNGVTYQDIRDDYIYSYFDLDDWDSVTLEFNVTLAYDGSYYIPAIQAEAMYDKDFYAVVPGTKLVK